jgi:hypothetical protein
VLGVDDVAAEEQLGGVAQADDARQKVGRAHVGAAQADPRKDEAEARCAAAMRRSQAAAMTAPAPTATPLTAAITGRRQVRMLWMSRPVVRVNSSNPCMSRRTARR